MRREWRGQCRTHGLHFIRPNLAFRSRRANIDSNSSQVILCQKKKHLDLFCFPLFKVMFQYFSHTVLQTWKCAYFIHCHWPFRNKSWAKNKSQVLRLESCSHTSFRISLYHSQGEKCGAWSCPTGSHWWATWCRLASCRRFCPWPFCVPGLGGRRLSCGTSQGRWWRGRARGVTPAAASAGKGRSNLVCN